MASSTTASADATGQSRLPKNSSHSVCPIIAVDDEPSRSGMTNSPTIGMKQSSDPAAMPDSESRHGHLKNRGQGRAPRFAGGLERGSVVFFKPGNQRRAMKGKYE